MEHSIFTSLFLTALMINSVIACVFMFVIPRSENRYHRNALYYFRGYFLIACLGCASFALRSVIPFTLSVTVTNMLFMLAVYCVVFGTWWRYQKRVHLYRHPLLLHVVAVMLIQGALANLYPSYETIRFVVIYFNVAGVLLYALSLFYRHGDQYQHSDRLLTLALSITVLSVLSLPITYFATNDPAVFVNVILLLQNSVLLVLFGAFNYVLYYDNLELYKSNAATDPVTGLYNRRHFFEQGGMFLHAAERHQFPISIIISEVDNFSVINDQFGYFAGDHVIRQIAGIIRQQTRNEDLVARYGDTKFVALLPQTRLNGALIISERMRESVQQTQFYYEQALPNLTASFGVMCIEKYSDIEASLLLADGALKEAKQAGRNCVRYYIDHSKSED